MAKRKKDRTDELLAELVKGKSPEEILGEGGILKQLTKRLVENALEGEMTEHLGYEPHAAEGKHTGNSRNGKGGKTSTRSLALWKSMCRVIAPGHSSRSSCGNASDASRASTTRCCRFTLAA